MSRPDYAGNFRVHALFAAPNQKHRPPKSSSDNAVVMQPMLWDSPPGDAPASLPLSAKPRFGWWGTVHDCHPPPVKLTRRFME
jgi:hypothetical protein